MAGGGQPTSGADSAKAQYDAAHQADPYVPTSATYQPREAVDNSLHRQAYQPPAEQTPAEQTPDPFAQNPTYTMPSGYGQSTLAQYFQNLPSYQQPGGVQSNKAFTSDLAARTAAQSSTLDTNLKAAEAERVRQSAEALKAFQIQRAKEEAAAAEAERQRQYQLYLDERMNDASQGFSGGNQWSGATGGLASLQGFN